MGTPFEDFAKTLFLKNSAGILFFIIRGAKCTKRGPKPPLLREIAPPPTPHIIDTKMYHTNRDFLRYRLVKYRQNTNRYQPKIPESVNKSTKFVNIY